MKNIYQSYTYLIGWEKLDRWYYGVRTANKCESEDDLWIHYFTSSKYVHEFRKEHGDPDIKEIDECFDDGKDAVEYEHGFLTENRIAQNESG